MLLKDVINDVFYYNEIHFTPEGENVLKELAISEHIINYHNLSFKSGDFGVKNFDFFKRFGTLYHFLNK